MVQPVRRRDAELNLLPLGDIEVLIQRQVAVEVGWPTHIGHVQGSLLPRELRRGEAVRIEVRARCVFTRIASYDRNQEVVRTGAEPGRWVHRIGIQAVRQEESVVWQVWRSHQWC